ncbi:MAG: MaoC family dehydratase N-terminal domain-containing protein [Hyphomonadaceae bacterium JAD_PAG50586_4]|nr:MAG: MaoC family dehydratase N-terminal domain-containing protein [Hyphomonadaceae bacterium JAD_PAG50586_4]
MNTEASATRRGIFDRSTKGKTIEPVSVFIERGRIRFFAQVLGNHDPMHASFEAARAAGHPDLLAPASFFVVAEALADEERARRALPSAAQLVKCDYRYLLHGDERYFYAGPIYAGDEVVHATTVLDFYDKKNGAMEFVSLESTLTHPTRGVLLRTTRTLLHRLPAQEG